MDAALHGGDHFLSFEAVDVSESFGRGMVACPDGARLAVRWPGPVTFDDGDNGNNHRCDQKAFRELGIKWQFQDMECFQCGCGE